MREREFSMEPSTAGHGVSGKFTAYGDISRACDRFFERRGMTTKTNLKYKAHGTVQPPNPSPQGSQPAQAKQADLAQPKRPTAKRRARRNWAAKSAAKSARLASKAQPARKDRKTVKK